MPNAAVKRCGSTSNLQADRTYSLSVYRQLEVQMQDVALDVSAQWNPQGDLQVTQTLANPARSTSASAANC